MKDLIDRKELLKIVEEDFSDDCGQWYIDQIEEAPRVEAEPVVHAHWKFVKTNSYGNVYKCSRCGRKLFGVIGMKNSELEWLTREYPYCHCGAKMDEVTDDESN